LLLEASKLNSKSAFPLLIKVNQEYIDSDIKVMIVGQETDGWYGQLNIGNHSVDDLMKAYFNYFYQETEHSKNRGKRAFWNRKNFKFFEDELKVYFASKNKSVSFIWNNISKIGNDGRGKPNDEIKQLERSYFDILKAEFKVLKPDIVIFTTGSSRDSYIRYHFGSEVIFTPKLSLANDMLKNETLNLLAEVKIPDFEYISAVRIEHPNRRTLSNIVSLSVIKEILKNKT